MRALSLAVVVLALGAIWQPVTPMFCAGAVAAMAAQEQQSPERHTPPGEWCQRRPVQSAKGHACACHAHNCEADPDDDNNHSAHTDPQCLNYCTVSQCRCAVMDCP